jgi:hypothetical protein
MLTFHAVGDWSPDQVRYEQIQSTRPIVPEVEHLIDQAWQRVSQQPGVHLFDGPMVRLESWRTAGDDLQLTLSRTSYKPFLGTNLYHPELADRYGRAILANPVGVSPALETSDGWLMFGRRNASVAYYPNRVHPFAGALEPRDACDAFAAVRRELAEELSLTDADVEEIRCTGIAEDVSIRQPELIFRARVRWTRSEVEVKLDQTEHHTTWAVRAEVRAVEQAIGRADLLTPVAVASLLLWGRRAAGGTWFDANAARIA